MKITKVYEIFPEYEVHSATTSGVVDFDYIGSLVAMITADFKLKIFGIDKSIERIHAMLFEEEIPVDKEDDNVVLRKVQYVKEIKSIFVSTENHLYHYIFDGMRIQGVRSIFLKSFQYTDYFHVASNHVLFVSGVKHTECISIEKIPPYNVFMEIESEREKRMEEEPPKKSSSLLFSL